MEDIMIILVVLMPIVGFILGYFLKIKAMHKKASGIVKEAEVEAEVIKKDKILQAKDRFLQLKEKHDNAINEKNNKILNVENNLKQSENNLNLRREEFKIKLKDFEITKQENNAIRQNLKTQLEVVLEEIKEDKIAFDLETNSADDSDEEQ